MPRPFQVMLSSRCLAEIPSDGGTATLSSVRIDLKKQIEAFLVADRKSAFDVWINEEGGPGPGDESAWEYCLERASRSTLDACAREISWDQSEGGIRWRLFPSTR